MSFLKVGFSSFRNLEDDELDVSYPRVFLVGDNGQGKTNFLEALYYLCYGSSFRGSVDSLIPRAGTSAFGLRASWRNAGALPVGVAAEGRAGEAGFEEYHGDATGLDDGILIKAFGKQKEIRLNDKLCKDRKELVEHNPAVVFCHEDFSFAAGEPERRRFFFDQCSGMISLSYIDTLRSYKKVLKQRNAVLKDAGARVGISADSAGELLDALDSQLAFYGLELMTRRRKLAEKFSLLFPDFFEKVSSLGRRIDLEYRSNWPKGMDAAEIERHLRKKRSDELSFGSTKSGPHRDIWRFVDKGEDFTEKASTGQLRLVSLVMRLVQIFIYKENIDNDLSALHKSPWPILLLDDVLLELDVPKRMRFLELLPKPESGAQSFFTFLPGEPWTEYADKSTFVYGVKDGRFENKTSF